MIFSNELNSNLCTNAQEDKQADERRQMKRLREGVRVMRLILKRVVPLLLLTKASCFCFKSILSFINKNSFILSDYISNNNIDMSSTILTII